MGFNRRQVLGLGLLAGMGTAAVNGAREPAKPRRDPLQVKPTEVPGYQQVLLSRERYVPGATGFTQWFRKDAPGPGGEAGSYWLRIRVLRTRSQRAAQAALRHLAERPILMEWSNRLATEPTPPADEWLVDAQSIERSGAYQVHARVDTIAFLVALERAGYRASQPLPREAVAMVDGVVRRLVQRARRETMRPAPNAGATRRRRP